MSKQTIPLSTAILICINTITGAGAFINLKQLSASIGKWGFASYIVSALALIPLILCISELGKRLPVSGGLYVYSKTYLNKYFGFLGGWGYFVSKTTSVGILSHLFVSYMKSNIPALQPLPNLFLDCMFIGLMVLISSFGALAKKSVQSFITLLKIIPFLFAFIIGFSCFDTTNFIGNSTEISSFFLAIPTALFAMVGFEIICAIGGLLENPEKNIRRSILIAFTIVACINILLQIAMFGSLGSDLATAILPLGNAGALVSPFVETIGKIVNGVFIASVFGSIIAMLSGNSWNLCVLAQNDHFPAKELLTQVNQFNIPYISLLVEGALACLILFITREFIPLQNMAVCALFISLGLTAASALQVTKTATRPILASLKAYAAMGLCAAILALCFVNMYRFGISLPFISIFTTGWIIAFFRIYHYKKESPVIAKGTSCCK